jgi:hypothetical protein
MSYIKEKHNRMAYEYAEEETSQYPFDPFDFGKSDKAEWREMIEDRPELWDRPDDYDDPLYDENDYPF